jgi:flavin-dependent dehydrogenase
LSAQAVPVLECLGLGHVLHNRAHRQANTRFAAWGRSLLVENHAMTSLHGPGYVLDRVVFQNELLARAQRFATCLPLWLVRSEPCDQGFQLTLSDGQVLNAGYVVDATGRAAVFAHRYSQRSRADRLVAAVSFLRQQHNDVEPTPATVIEAVENGWWYAALLADKRMVVAYFSDPDLVPRGVTRNPTVWSACLAKTLYIQRWLDDAGYTHRPLPSLHTAGTTWMDIPAHIRADGALWLAAGDAAMALDPLSSHGLTTALWGGWQAGLIIHQTLQGNAQALRNYVAAIEKGRLQYMQERARLYALERRYLHMPFWCRRASFN